MWKKNMVAKWKIFVPVAEHFRGISIACRHMFVGTHECKVKKVISSNGIKKYVCQKRNSKGIRYERTNMAAKCKIFVIVN